MKTIDGVRVWGEAEDEVIKQIKMSSEHSVGLALMADNHVGYSVPIGGVLVLDKHISPSGVGYDIACGNKAVLLDVDPEYVKSNIKKIMDEVWNSISFGVGRKNDEKVDHQLFESDDWSLDAVCGNKNLARQQLGTIGSGNHYVDIFVDEQNRIWCGVHFGSRGLGHKTATWFFEKAGAKDGMMVPPVFLEEGSDLGEQYIRAMNLCGEYAYAGRDWVCGKVASILGAKILKEVHNHHNFAWKENGFWVVRKGATPAFPGQESFVGGSMGDISVIIKGLDTEESKLAFRSTIHGAGRVLGRRKAAGKFKWKMDESVGRKVYTQIERGLISREMMDDWIKPLGVELRGAGTDESPHCYKRLPEVLKAHEGSVEVLHTLTPLGVAMAGELEIDPYRD